MARGSQADYSPENLAKSMEFFHSILNGRGGNAPFGICNMAFFYDTIIGLHEEGADPHERVIVRGHPACEQTVAPTIRDIKIL